MFAFDATALGDEAGGYARYTEELAKRLAAAKNCCLLHRPQWPAPASCVQHRISPFRNRVITEQLWLPRQLADMALLHVPAYAGPWPALGRTKLVVTVHDVTHLRSVGRGFLNRMYWRHILAKNLDRADLVVTDSHASAAALRAAHTIVPARLRVVYPGVATLPAGGLPAGCPAEPFILMVGIRPARKRAELLIGAHRRMKNSVPLVLVGQPEHVALPASLPGRPVIVTGDISDSELGALYRRAAMLAYPSAEEGFGLPPLEAAAHGCPVAAAPSAAVKETAGPGCRYVAEPTAVAWAAALDELLTCAAVREKLITTARSRAAEFSWDTAAAQLMKIYHELLA